MDLCKVAKEDMKIRLAKQGQEKVLAGAISRLYDDRELSKGLFRNPPEAPNEYNKGISVSRDLPKAPSRYAISYEGVWGLVALEVETSLLEILDRILPAMHSSLDRATKGLFLPGVGVPSSTQST